MPKEKIHPNYAAVRVMCACGNNFETRSTHKGDIHVEICSVCHPFFTGKQRLVDTAGRVERFRRKYAKAERGDARPSKRARRHGWIDWASAAAEAQRSFRGKVQLLAGTRSSRCIILWLARDSR